MKRILSRVIPNVLKNKILSSQQHEKYLAGKMASTSKRLDICSAQFAHNLHLTGCPSLSGKVCLEIGSGWVLTHALICYLLGANRVIATDIVPHAYPRVLFSAIHESVISIIRDVLSPFEAHHLIRSRLDNLLQIREFDFEVLKSLGIDYLAPFDFTNNRLNQSVDFVFSNSVLELVPYDEVPLFLNNIVFDLAQDGAMIHAIHLEDHKNITGDPFGFLSISKDDLTRSVQSSRGNRVRKSGWQEYFTGLKNCKSNLFYEWSRNDKELPAKIDQSIRYKDVADLRISHIGVYTRKDQI